MTTIKWLGKEYPSHNGSPFGRGHADFFYHRPRGAHKGGNAGSGIPLSTDLTPEEREAYHAGYDWAEEQGDQKEY